MKSNPIMVNPSDLKPHPKNYKVHPPEQIEHIIQSIKDHGIYRNIVVARDDTILAGHGVVLAAIKMGLQLVPIQRLDIDPYSPAAYKVIVGDNEIAHLGEVDDRLLSEILKEIKDSSADGLLGTGYDEMGLADLIIATRPEVEIPDMNAALDYLGIKKDGVEPPPLKISMNFRTIEDKLKFGTVVGMEITEKTRAIWYTP